MPVLWQAMLEPVELGDFVSDLTGLAGEALYAGRLTVTMMTVEHGSISLTFTGVRRMTPRNKYAVPLWDAQMIYVGIAHSRDRVAVIYLDGKHAGKMFPEKDWDTGRITADPVRYWAARKVLDVCRGTAEYSTAQYVVMLGTECLRCGTELTEPESITDRLGPICKGKVSAQYGQRHQHRSTIPTPQPKEDPPPPTAGGSLFTIQPGEPLSSVYSRLNA